MLKFVKSLSRGQKRRILILVDLAIVPLALIFAFGVQATPVSYTHLTLPTTPYV